jgi:hypothetical protein
MNVNDLIPVFILYGCLVTVLVQAAYGILAGARAERRDMICGWATAGVYLSFGLLLAEDGWGSRITHPIFVVFSVGALCFVLALITAALVTVAAWDT